MKNYFLATLALITLVLPVVSQNAKEQSEAAVALQVLVKSIQVKLDQGKRSKADLAVELKKFDSSLLAEYGARAIIVAEQPNLASSIPLL